jgi:hypothetical protein
MTAEITHWLAGSGRILCGFVFEHVTPGLANWKRENVTCPQCQIVADWCEEHAVKSRRLKVALSGKSAWLPMLTIGRRRWTMRRAFVGRSLLAKWRMAHPQPETEVPS